MLDTPAMRDARPEDIEQLLPLWASLFDDDPVNTEGWRAHARDWFAQTISDPTSGVFPVIDVDGQIVACAVGLAQLVAPNPQCPTGRSVHLMNVVTLPDFRGRGFASALTNAVIAWARRIESDRVDLNASPEGQRIYERIGFTVATAPRMKLPL